MKLNSKRFISFFAFLLITQISFADNSSDNTQATTTLINELKTELEQLKKKLLGENGNGSADSKGGIIGNILKDQNERDTNYATKLKEFKTEVTKENTKAYGEAKKLAKKHTDKLTKHHQKLKEHDELIDEAYDRIYENEIDITKNQDNIEKNKESIKKNKEKLQRHDLVLKNHNERIRDNETAIKENVERLDHVEDIAYRNEKKVNNHSIILKEHNQRIRDNESLIKQNTERLDDVEGIAYENERQIAILGNELQNVSAMNSALSALSPLAYDPLRPSQLMAGMGGYKGKKAFAVGLSHYVSENTLVKAGVSVGSDEGIMLNAGITHKFGSKSEIEKLPMQYQAGAISSVYAMQKEMQDVMQENKNLKMQLEEQRREIEEIKKLLSK